MINNESVAQVSTRRKSFERPPTRSSPFSVIWIVSGSPRVIVSGRPKRLKPRGSVDVPRGAWHRIENPGRVPVVLIEVQHGPYLGEDDIIRRQDDYGRAGATTAKPKARPRRRKR